MIRYLSKEYIDQEHQLVDEVYCPKDGYDCGGTWTFDGPPCGGCNSCGHLMTAHWIYKEIDRMRMFQKAGFQYADPNVIDREEISKHVGPYGGWGEYHGQGGYHCWCAKEIQEPMYSWNRKG